jgi:hypothetical protein
MLILVLSIVLFIIFARTGTRSPVEWVPSFLPPGVDRPGLEVDHFPLSISDVKNVVTLRLPPVKLHSVDRDQFTRHLLPEPVRSRPVDVMCWQCSVLDFSTYVSVPVWAWGCVVVKALRY